MQANTRILALALGAFGFGLAEFAPLGFMPAMASGLDVSIPAAGTLISAYALGVGIGAPLMILSTARLPRRTALLILVAMFTVGSFLTALSQSYYMALTARVLASLSHAAFFGVAAVVASNLARPGRQAQAVATFFFGLTAATVVGVPVSSWIGEKLGWQTPFWIMGVLGLGTMVALRMMLPPLVDAEAGGAKAELRALFRAPVIASLALSAVTTSSMFIVYTYIAPLLRDVTHASLAFTAVMLSILGIGLSVGNWLGGKLADKSVERALVITLSALICILIVFTVAMPYKIPTGIVIFLWAVASFAVTPPLQVRVMNVARDAPHLSSSMNVGSFNLGNAIGAAVGGQILSQGLDYQFLTLAAAGVAAFALLMTLVFGVWIKKAG